MISNCELGWIGDAESHFQAPFWYVHDENEETRLLGMLRRGALERTDFSEELSSPILVILMMDTLDYSETSVLTRATWRNIPEDAILHSGGSSVK
jgi:hypothetical protein